MRFVCLNKRRAGSARTLRRQAVAHDIAVLDESRHEARMRLFILGATGRTGRALLAQARERDYALTAFVRSPQKLGALQEGVAVRQGDPRSVGELRHALSGHDAVVSALGPTGLRRTTILRDCAHSTVVAMQAEGVRRLLVVSAAMLFQDAGIFAAVLRHTLLRNVPEDAAEMERAVRPADWTGQSCGLHG
jgi:nucleoside-diphosphate-sugar epimerase